MRDLKTIVHVESRSRNWRVRKISATPASPLWVARRMCSIYFALGGASCALTFQSVQAHRNYRRTAFKDRGELTLILVAPFTDFSKFCVIVPDQLVRTREKRSWREESKKRRTRRRDLKTDLCRRLPFSGWRIGRLR